jgi:hypothetical protein
VWWAAAGDIASALGRLISSPCVEIDGAAIRLDALDRYRKTKVHFVDCLIAATTAHRKHARCLVRSGLPKVHGRSTFAWKSNSFVPHSPRLRVPRVYLSWAIPVYLAFFAFMRINNLHVFNAAFSSIPTAPTKSSLFFTELQKT